jgi:hypothetical protein
MVSKRFAAITIVFNIIMALLMLISYQLILILFEGHGSIIVEGFWLYGEGPYPSGEPQLVSTHPTLNFPLIIFILILIVDSYFLVRIRRNKN